MSPVIATALLHFFVPNVQLSNVVTRYVTSFCGAISSGINCIASLEKIDSDSVLFEFVCHAFSRSFPPAGITDGGHCRCERLQFLCFPSVAEMPLCCAAKIPCLQRFEGAWKCTAGKWCSGAREYHSTGKDGSVVEGIADC